MSQDNKKSFVMYQGGGDNHFPVPMTKGKYGTISVAFVRRGLDQYEYNPTTWGLNGNLFAWDLSGTRVYTDTATPAVGATIYDQYGVGTGDTVSAISGDTITVNTNVYTRDALHDVDENTVLTWTGNTLQIGDYIVIERTTTRTQPFEFQNNQKHIEKSDDNLERQIQEVADKVDNALLVDPTHTIDSNKMNPVEWMKTILRSVDKSVRGFRYLNGWLDYSLDDPNIADVDKTWTHLVNTDNIKAIREQSRIENNETIYYTEYLAQDGAWKILSDPHKWDNMKLSDLADTDFTNLSAGNFIMYDGLKWKNVYSSATAGWGTIIGNITDQTDLMNKFTEYVRTDGTSVMTAPLLMRATDDFKCAIAPYWDGVGFFKLNDNNSVTLMASIEYNSGFEPATTNTYNIGASARKWKNLYLAGKAYVATINNGADLSVPNKSGTLATMGDVELAARSGRMLTDQGKWYAKMYSSSTVPTGAEYDGRNYADFSQVDSDNNPIIVIYEGQNGNWVQGETITPPAEYDGYVSITSKIWDIVEQSGQQGGRVLWNHTSKEFTPEPRIVSTNDIEVTGSSTVIMPLNPSGNQIVNKDYVDSHVPTGGYHPSLFAHEWDDKLRDDVQWLRADTFSWQPGSAYEAAYKHLADDICVSSEWRASAPATYIYTKNSIPAIGDTIYSDSACTTSIGSVEGYDSIMNAIIYNNRYFEFRNTIYVTPQTETIAGTTITYYLADDGHKIVLADQESNVSAIYNATGVAWYYVLDATNKQFKLPRSKHNRYAATLGVAGNGMTLGVTDGTNNAGVFTAADNPQPLTSATNDYGKNVGTTVTGGRLTTNKIVGITTDASKSGMVAQQEEDTDQYKYLYFYVGEFTQTAIENTAGLNAEDFNDKADTDFGNTSMIDYVTSFQRPTAENNYTWYRKYKSGWIEQGGRNNGLSAVATITMPNAMADIAYSVLITRLVPTTADDPVAISHQVRNLTTTTFQVRQTYAAAGTGTGPSYAYVWEVKGMAA